MKSCLAAAILMLFLVSGAFAAGKGPEINLVDNKLSVNAEAITLGRLLRLLDLATGMQSKVPQELANRSLSVRFSDLSVDDGVRKIFEGQPFDYVVMEGRGVIVTGAAQASPGAESVPVYNPGPQQPQPQPFPQPNDQPFVPDFQPPGTQPGVPGQPGIPGVPGQPGQGQPQQPAMIQTPFGPIANPRANQTIQQQGMPPAAQPQQNPLFPGQQTTSPVGGTPAPTPFGAPSPFGTPQTTPNNGGLFGAPTVFGAPGGTRPQ